MDDLIYASIQTEAKLILSKKCQFFQLAAQCFGCILDASFVRRDPQKTRIIAEFPAPWDVTELQRFMGFIVAGSGLFLLAAGTAVSVMATCWVRFAPRGYDGNVAASDGSVLGPLLFMIYTNDLEENVAGLISKFADDTKIGGVVGSEEDCQRIWQDIDELEAWAEKWQMEFNLDR
eukprot:g38565.t1